MVFCASPCSACEWDVTRLVFTVVALPYVVVGPYSTCVSPGALVTHPIVAPDAVIDRAVTADRVGAGSVLPAVRPLLTVMIAGADRAEFPAASLATAVRVCAPLVAALVSQTVAYGAPVASLPRFTPSSLNWTPATPTLSVALAVMVMMPLTVAPAVGAVRDTVGGVVSLLTVPVTAADVAVLPAASRATAVSV